MQTQKFFRKYSIGDLTAKVCPSKLLYYTVIYGLGAYTHIHTHTLVDESDYKKPGARLV